MAASKRILRPARYYSSEAALLEDVERERRARLSGAPLPVVPGAGFTERQRRAMELPVYPPDGPGRWEGLLVRHHVDPRHREVEMHVEPDRTEVSRYSSFGRGAVRERKRYQLRSILTVDMESWILGPRPVWHASVAWYANVGEEIWRTDRWAGKQRGHWMADRALAKVASLIPEFGTRDVTRDAAEDRLSLHFRSPLTTEERAVFAALAKPRLYAAPPGIRRELAAARGELPNRVVGE